MKLFALKFNSEVIGIRDATANNKHVDLSTLFGFMEVSSSYDITNSFYFEFQLLHFL